MKLITKNTDYAIRALMHLADKAGEVVPASVISEEENIPAQFLKRLLQTLIKAGYLAAKEGKGGGVRLDKGPESIRVLDIMRVFQGDFQISECMFRKNMCPNRRKCVLRAKVKVIEKNLENEFAKITIAELVNKKVNGKG